MVGEQDSDTDFLNIISWVLLGDTFAPYLSIICLGQACLSNDHFGS